MFNFALNLVHSELYSIVRHSLLGSIQTKSMVETAFSNRKKVHESGKIILLDKYIPWQKCIVEVEEENKCEGSILFVIFPGKGKEYRIQAVAAKEGSFELRKGLKEDWRGIKDGEKLIKLSGIEDINFVHASGFIGGARTLESTLKMGVMSL